MPEFYPVSCGSLKGVAPETQSKDPLRAGLLLCAHTGLLVLATVFAKLRLIQYVKIYPVVIAHSAVIL